MGNFAFPNLASGAAAPPAKTSNARSTPIIASEEITVAAAGLTLNALFGNIRVPKNAVIQWVQFASTDVDTNGAPAVVFTMGDTVDDDRLMTANTGGQTGAVPYGPGITVAGYGYQYTAETLISLKCTVIPATAAAGTLKYSVCYVSP